MAVPILTRVGMKNLLMGDGNRWESVSTCGQSPPSATILEIPIHTIRTRHGSAWLNPSEIPFNLLVGEFPGPRDLALCGCVLDIIRIEEVYPFG